MFCGPETVDETSTVECCFPRAFYIDSRYCCVYIDSRYYFPRSQSISVNYITCTKKKAVFLGYKKYGSIIKSTFRKGVLFVHTLSPT